MGIGERVKGFFRSERERQHKKSVQRKAEHKEEKKAYEQEYRKAKIEYAKVKARKKARADVNKPSFTERLSKIAAQPNPFILDFGMFEQPRKRRKKKK
jgi:hypothetical protein